MSPYPVHAESAERDSPFPQPAARRPWQRGRRLAFLSMMLLAGMAGALIWMAGPQLGSLELLPEDPTAQEQTAQAATSTPEPSPLPSQESTQVVAPQVVGPNPAALRDVDLRTVVAPPTSTPTRTPIPPLDAVEAVVGTGGATLWEADSGIQVTHVAQGELLSVGRRSTDGQWLYATTSDGDTGWVEADRLIAFDTRRLRVEDVVIIPITPTPGMGGDTAWLTPTPAAAQPGEAVLPSANTATARVIVDDARLNIRSGPGSDAAIVAKVDPETILVVRGRNAAADWLQVSLPDDAAAVGWVAAEFVEVSVPLDSLPVVDGSSVSPVTGGGQEGTKGGQVRPHTAEAVPVALYPTSTPAAKPVAPQPQAVGLQGKLAIQTTWGGDIYLYDLAAGTLRHLTGGFDPAISPDGMRVAFTRAGGEHGLYLIQADSSNERLIFSGRELLRSPKWSPDGRYIVFERGDEVLRCNPTDVDDPASPCLPGPNISTERQQKLARVDVNGGSYQDIPVLERARVPDWNAAGIVYQSPAGIQMTQDDPGAQTKLVFFNIRKQYELDPDWQPNGGRIIFQRREADHWEIYSVNPDGSGLFALTRPEFTLVDQMPSNVAPAWSPDGQRIVFLSNRLPDHNAGPWRVWVMDADGSNPHPLPIDLDFTYTFVAEQMLDWGR